MYFFTGAVQKGTGESVLKQCALHEEEACRIVDINIKYNKFWAQSIILSSVAWVGRLISI